MLTFTEKRQQFLKNIRMQIVSEKIAELPKTDSAVINNVEDDLATLLNKKFDELFGPIDDDS